MLEFIIFLIGSFGFFLLSIQSLTKPFSHGFPRFFAFEAILGLVILNAPFWFVKPFSISQIISWALLVNSAFMAVHAFYTLHKFGQADASIEDASRLGLEKTTHLVTNGPYRYIRHPLYASLLCFASGVFMKQIGYVSILLLILVSLSLYLTARFEERENWRNFGEGYAEYMQLTKRFIPFLI